MVLRAGTGRQPGGVAEPLGRPAAAFPEPRLGPEGWPPDPLEGLLPEQPAAQAPRPDGLGLDPLVAEWLRDLQIQGRSSQTMSGIATSCGATFATGGAQSLDQLTGSELKRHLAQLQARELSPESVHGHFAALRAFARWAARESYPVDPSFFRVRPPQVPQKEMESYSEAQPERVLEAAPEGWPRLAILILLGTGMRVGELCGFRLEDIEDDGEAAFFKIRRGKGAKFRRVPISRRLRRELVRYLNRIRPTSSASELLLRQDGKPVRLETVTELLKRIKRRVGFRVNAHKFRHTFATEYLRQVAR